MEFTRKYYAATPGGSTGNTGNSSSNDTQKAAESAREAFADIQNTLRGIEAGLREGINEQLRGMEDRVKTVGKSIQRDLTSVIKETGKVTKALRDSTDDLGKSLVNEAQVKEQILRNEQRQVDLVELLNELEREGLEVTAQMRQQQADLATVLHNQNVALKTRLLYIERTNKAMGLYGKALQGLSRVPILGQLVDADKILEKMKTTAAETGSRFKALGTGLKETFKSMANNLTDLTVLIPGLIGGFIKLVKLAAEYQSKQFEAAKDLGVSVQRGQQLRDNFVALAKANMALGVTADQLQKSYAGVQDELGIIVKQSNEFNLTSTLIERRTGATAAHMLTLQFAAKKMSTSLADAYTKIIGSAKAEGARVKLAMSEKQILEGISKVSATIYQNFKGNYKQIAAAVVESKKLGVTLDQINGIQDQFLDFETSIQKQFEAEVLTGKELDLTRIRQLALTHKTGELMKEIVKITGTAAEFNKLDTISQMAKAEALGMSRDQVHQMLMDQEKAKLLGEAAGADLQTQYNLLLAQGKTREQIAGIMGAEATQSAYMASVSEKLAATMDAIKNTIAQMATALLPLVDSIATWLANSNNLKKVFQGIVGIMSAMVGYSLAMKTINMINTAAMTRQLALKTAQNVQAKQAVTITGFQTAASKAQMTQEAGIAGAKVTQGSWYLGPGAAAVGAAAFALLMGLIGASAAGSIGGGGGSSNAPSFNVSSPGGSTAPIAPMNVPAATAAVNTSTAATSTAGLTNVSAGGGAGNVYIDGYKVGQILFNDTHDQVIGKDKT